MPAAAVIPAVGGVVGAGLGLFGQHKAGKAQEKSTDQAILLQQQQDAEQRRQFDIQEAARRADVDRQIKFMQFQWQAAAPLRAARNSVLAKYGITASEPQMPDFSSMAAQSGGIAPGGPPPGMGMPTPRGGGGGGGLGMLGAGLAGAGLGVAGALAARRPQTPSIAPGDLSSWSQWAGYGIPGQEYQGE